MSGFAGLFTNPMLLWFLPLALIPVLLHLLTPRDRCHPNPVRR